MKIKYTEGAVSSVVSSEEMHIGAQTNAAAEGARRLTHARDMLALCPQPQAPPPEAP